jgi:hypothetical protein
MCSAYIPTYNRFLKPAVTTTPTDRQLRKCVQAKCALLGYSWRGYPREAEVIDQPPQDRRSPRHQITHTLCLPPSSHSVRSYQREQLPASRYINSRTVSRTATAKQRRHPTIKTAFRQESVDHIGLTTAMSTNPQPAKTVYDRNHAARSTLQPGISQCRAA